MKGLYREDALDAIVDVTAREAEETARAVARAEGLLVGISGGGAIAAALKMAAAATVNSATATGTAAAGPPPVVVALLPDRGDRYLSTGVFGAAAGARDPAPVAQGEFYSALPRLLFGGAPGAPCYTLFRSPPGAGAGGAGADADAAEAAAAAAVRAAVEGGGGRLLEVVLEAGGGGAEFARALRRHHGLDIGGGGGDGNGNGGGGGAAVTPGPALARWGADGAPRAVLHGAALRAGGGAAAAAAARAFVRETWDD